MYGQDITPKPKPNPVPAVNPNDDRDVSLDEWDDIVADNYKVPKNLFKAMTSQESGGDVNAVSPTGVRGRQQVTERVARSYGLDRNDPFQQSVAAARYLRDQYDALGDVKDEDERWLGALGRYYGGSSAVKGGELSGKSVDGLSNPAEHVSRVAEKWGAMNRGESGTQAAPAVQPKPQTKPPQRRAGPVGPRQQPEPSLLRLTQPTGFQSVIEKALGTSRPQKPGPLRIEDLQTQEDPRFMTPEERRAASDRFLQNLAVDKARAEAAMKAQVEEEAARAPSSTIGGVGSRFGRGVVRGAKGALQAPLLSVPDNPFAEKFRADIGQKFEDVGREYFPIDQRNPAKINPLSGDFWTAENIGKVLTENLPEAAGSMLPYLLLGRGAGLAGRLAGGAELAASQLSGVLPRLGIKTVEDLASAAGVSGLGTLQGANQGYEAAKAAGLDEDAARKSAAIEGFIGLLEGVGSPGTRGTFMKSALAEIPRESRQEFVQEAFSQLLQGVNAAYLTGYEPNKTATDVIGEAIGAGGIGGVLGGLGAAPGAIAGLRTGPTDQSVPPSVEPVQPIPPGQPPAPQNLQAAAEAAMRNQQPGAQSAAQQALNERIQALEARGTPEQPGVPEKDTRDLDQRISDADAMAPADSRLAISEYQKALAEIRKTPAYRQEAIAKGQGQAVETPNMDRVAEIEQRIKALQEPATPAPAPEQTPGQPDIRVYNPGEQPGTPQRGRALTTFRAKGQEFFVEYPRNISARAAISMAKQQSAGEATGQPSEIDALRAEFQQQGAARQVEQQMRQEAGLSPRAQRGAAERQAFFDTAQSLADEAGARAEQLLGEGRTTEAITELRAQQKALNDAVRYLPRTPESLRTKDTLQRQSGQIGQRIGDLRRAGGSQPPASPPGGQPRVEPLLESRVNPQGGIPEQAPAYEPGASFERLAAESRAPREEEERLLTAIRRAGGIRDDGDTSGELRRLGIREAGTTGLVNNRSGVSPDEMREMMVSEGLSRAETVGEFFDEIEQEMRAAQTRKGREEEDLGEYYEQQARQEPAPQPRTVGSYLDEVAGELELDEVASLRQAMGRFERENPRPYEDRTRPGEPGSGGVSLSPYAVLVQNNREQTDRLYELDLRSDEAREIIDGLRDYAVKNGIELKHLHALLDYVRNYQIDQGSWENRGLTLEETQVAEREETLGYLNDQERRVNQVLESAIARLDDRAVEWIRRSGREIDELLQTLNEDPDMMALFDGAIANDQDYAAFEQGAVNTYGFSTETARYLVEQEREGRRIGSTNRGRAAAARVEEKLARADRERPAERSDQESAGRPGAGRGLTARDFNLLTRNPEEIPDNQFDDHLRAIEDLRNQGVKTSLFGGVDLTAGEERQIQAVISMLNDVRQERRKAGRVGRKNEPERVPSMEERQERYRLQEETRDLPEEERQKRLTELRQRQAEESGKASARKLTKQELGEEMKKGAEPRTVTHPDPELDGKPVIAETQDGRLIVPNPENKSGVSVVKDRSDEDTEHKFSSTQVNLPAALADKVKEFGRRIPDEDLAEDGREDEPHITVKYGLRGSRAGAIREVLEGEGPIRATLGKVSLFTTNPDFDVVKIEVESEDLARLNQAIREAVPNEEKFPEYQPHVTIAYVKKGKAAKYVGDTSFEGQQVDFDKVLFSGRAGNRENISVAESAIIPPNAESRETTESTLAGGREAPARRAEGVLGAGESAPGGGVRPEGQPAQSTGVSPPGREATGANARERGPSGGRSGPGKGESTAGVRQPRVSRRAEELANRQSAAQRENAPARPESPERVPRQASAESALPEGAPRQNQPGRVAQRADRGSGRQSIETPRGRTYEEAGRIPVAETQTPGGIPLSAATGEEPQFVRDARQRLKQSAKGERAGSGGQQLADQAIVVGYKVYRAGMNFSQWARAMIKEVGQPVRPYLQQAWAQIQAFYRDEEGSLKVSPGRRASSVFDEFTPETRKALEEKKVNRFLLESLRTAVRENISPEYLNQQIQSLRNFEVDPGTIDRAIAELRGKKAELVSEDIKTRAQLAKLDFEQINEELTKAEDRTYEISREIEMLRGDDDMSTARERLTAARKTFGKKDTPATRARLQRAQEYLRDVREDTKSGRMDAARQMRKLRMEERRLTKVISDLEERRVDAEEIADQFEQLRMQQDWRTASPDRRRGLLFNDLFYKGFVRDKDGNWSRPEDRGTKTPFMTGQEFERAVADSSTFDADTSVGLNPTVEEWLRSAKLQEEGSVPTRRQGISFGKLEGESAGGTTLGAGLGSLNAWTSRPAQPRAKVPLPSDWSGAKWSGNLAKQLREGVAAGKISDRRATKIVEAIDEALAAEASGDGARLFLAREDLAQLTGEKFSLADIAGAPRSIKAGLDLSFAFRQGGAYNYPGLFLRPIETLRRIGKGVVAMREVNYADVNAQIAARPRFNEMMESGLHLVNHKKLEGNKLTDREEGYISRFMQNVPGYKQSERGNTTLLDLLRADAFDRYATYLNKRGITFENNPRSFKEMARFVNLMTGRGDLGKYQGAVPFLSLGFFSPSWVASRVQLLALPFNPRTYRGVDPAVRRLMWRDLGSYAGAMGLTLGLVAAAGAAGLAAIEVGDDPEDSDFGKVVIAGKYHYDLSSGLGQYLVFAHRMVRSSIRMYRGEKLRESQKPSAIALRFLRSKASPAGSLAANLMTGEDFSGQPISAKSAALDLVYPLLIKDFMDGYNLEGGSLAAGLASLPAMLGVGYGAHEKGGQASKVPALAKEAEKYDVFFGEKAARGALQGEPGNLTKERLARRRQYVEKYGTALIDSNVYKSATEEGKAALLKRFNDVSNDLANEKAPDLAKLNPARLEAALRQGGKQAEQNRRRAAQRQIYARPPAGR